VKTIVAIATPNTVSSVCMLRISGDDALTIADKVFAPISGQNVETMRGYRAAYGQIKDGGTIIDDGVLLVFCAPKSYTGENVAEITCHGGVYIARRVLEACINAGAVHAEPGEFTKRAVLNGKLTLTEAESVIDVINASSEQQLTSANAQKTGALHKKIQHVTEEILSISAGVAVVLDYPEEGNDDFHLESVTPLLKRLKTCQSKLSELLGSYDVAKTMREGILTAIVGKPNVGKSTIMNLMTRRNRSIVTDIPGTTRDIIEETLCLDGTLLRLCDCAGIRRTDDTIEQIGIEYMYKQIDDSSLVFAVFDNSRPLCEDDYDLLQRIYSKNTICIINKCDLSNELDLSELTQHFSIERIIKLSAASESVQDLSRITELVKSVCEQSAFDFSAGYIANQRQRACVVEADEQLSKIISGLEEGQGTQLSLDVVGFMLSNVLEALYKLSGESASSAMIDEIFKNFCVGK